MPRSRRPARQVIVEPAVGNRVQQGGLGQRRAHLSGWSRANRLDRRRRYSRRVSAALDPSLVRHGRVNGRYFRENFAQGGIDLVQIIPELVTNADSAIALGGRPSGRIVLRFGPPEPGFAAEWKRAMRRLRAPALLDWRHELRCSDDGVGMDAAAVDRRLGALGVLPDASGQRGLFGRGLRDVWLAQGGGRLRGRARRPRRRVVVLPLRRRRPVRLRARARRAGSAPRIDAVRDAHHGAAGGRAAAGERAAAAAGRPARAVAAGAGGPRAPAVAGAARRGRAARDAAGAGARSRAAAAVRRGDRGRDAACARG